MVLVTPVFELVVDELAAVVAVNTPEGEGQGNRIMKFFGKMPIILFCNKKV